MNWSFKGEFLGVINHQKTDLCTGFPYVLFLPALSVGCIFRSHNSRGLAGGSTSHTGFCGKVSTFSESNP
jgi:hypothetical protein